MRKSVLFSLAALACTMSAVGDEAGSPAGASEATATDGTKIRPNMEKYQTAKSAGGSSTKICGDEVSLALLGATLDEAYGFVATVTNTAEAVLRDKYGSKNPGQQRMFLGNLIRGASQSKDAEKKARVEAAFREALPAFREAIDARLAVAAQTKADEKAAKEKLKADAKAKKEADAKAEKEARAKAALEKKAADDAAKAQAKAKPTQAKGPGAPGQPA